MHDTPDARRDTEGVDDDLLSRYLAGQCTATERARVREWLAGDPSRHTTLEAFTRALAEPESQMRAESALGAGWARVMAKIGVVEGPSWPAAGGADDLRADADRTENPAVVRPRPGARPRLWPRGVGGRHVWHGAAIAASVLLALGIGLGLGIRRHRAGSSVATGREYATAAGQRLSVTLVDGTQLTLAPASRIRLAADYGQGTRRVELEGEAYFTAAHDAAHPFAVRAHGAVAHDVGTAFDVRAYAEDAGARIAVAEGAVAVSTADICHASMAALGVVGGAVRKAPLSTHRRTLPLSASLEAQVDAGVSDASAADGLCSAEARAGDVVTVVNEVITVKHGTDIAALTAWTQAQLVFDDTPLPSALTELSRWYGVELRIGDPGLASRHISATVFDEPLEAMLTQLAASVGARYERVGPVITLHAAATGR